MSSNLNSARRTIFEGENMKIGDNLPTIKMCEITSIENVKTSYRNGFEMYFTHLHTIVHNILGKFTHIVSERGKEKKSL